MQEHTENPSTQVPAENSSQEKQEAGILGTLGSTPMDRRRFLKLSLLVAGASAVLAACKNPDEVFSFEQGPLKENAQKLNNQFAEIEGNYLNIDGSFDYERFKTNPNFERYITEIHTNSEKVGRELEINPNAIKLMTSAIVSSNLGTWSEINSNQPPNTIRERVGAMQFHVTPALDTLRSQLKDNYNYTAREIEGIFNIQIGINHLIYGSLGKIATNGDEDILTLTVAKYYGGDDLLTHVRENREVAEGSFLREGYDKYNSTVASMKLEGIPDENVAQEETEEDFEMEAPIQEVWNKATKFWPKTNLKLGKRYLYEQAKAYAKDDIENNGLGISAKEYFALFISIAMTESNGGTNLGPNLASGARGWFQVVPKYHLWEYNRDVGSKEGVQYSEDDLIDNIEASIKVGVWALMRYRYSEGYRDIKKLMETFKGGHHFSEAWDDGIWWNRVCYCTTSLLGEDRFGMGYMDYQLPEYVRWQASDFLQNSNHIGNVKPTEEI